MPNIAPPAPPRQESAETITAPSSAAIIPLQPKRDFARAAKAWLQQWQEDPRLSHSDRTLCTQIFLHFNTKHFEKTGKLLAWPSWATFVAKTGLSKASTFRGTRKLERLGAVEVEHGRYNHEKKQRAGNLYWARESKVSLVTPCTPDQGFISVQNQGFTGEAISSDKEEVANLRKNQGFNLGSEGSGLPTKKGLEEKATTSPEVPPSFNGNSRPASAGGDGPPRGAYVGFFSPLMVRLEAFERRTGKTFPRDKRGGWWLTPDQLAAVEAGV